MDHVRSLEAGNAGQVPDDGVLLLSGASHLPLNPLPDESALPASADLNKWNGTSSNSDSLLSSRRGARASEAVGSDVARGRESLASVSISRSPSHGPASPRLNSSLHQMGDPSQDGGAVNPPAPPSSLPVESVNFVTSDAVTERRRFRINTLRTSSPITIRRANYDTPIKNIIITLHKYYVPPSLGFIKSSFHSTFGVTNLSDRAKTTVPSVTCEVFHR